MFSDTLGKLPKVLTTALNPCLSRMNASRAIINVLNLALHSSGHSEEATFSKSLLLLDPAPEFMTNALSCTASSLFTLHDTQELSSRTFQTMVSVVLTSLKLLSQVSYAACDALSSFKQMCSQKNIQTNIQTHNTKVGEGLATSIEMTTDSFAIATIWNAEFTEEAVKELRFQSSLDQMLVSNSFATRELANVSSPGMGLLEHSDWTEPLFQTQDWNIRVCLLIFHISLHNCC